MCGILLILSKKKELNKSLCLKAKKSIFNRGRDFEKYEILNSKRLFVYNSILSIQGKIEKKLKLYTSKNKKIKITYNGEIFNYSEILKKFFKNEKFLNDTELYANIFQKKGKIKIIKKIEGMYASSFIDEKKKLISFLTDPQGERRLYYFQNSDYLIISSNFKSILIFLNIKIKENLNFNTFKDYFHTRHFMMEDETIFKQIKVVKPGTLYSYNYKNFKMKMKYIDNPIDWISEKDYNKYEKCSSKEILKIADKKFKKIAKIITPKRNFSAVISGGIDSSLQAFLLKDSRYLKKFFSLDHYGKDNIISQNKLFFEKKLRKKIFVQKINEKNYSKILLKLYDDFKIPMLSHDMVGRFMISKLAKKFNSKVIFIADGADEIFCGYDHYKKNITNKFRSMYSSFNTNNYKSKSLLLDSRYNKIYQKYHFIKNKKERAIQSNAFNDYLSNSINTFNIMNDLIISNNSIETRNIFIQKEILKFGINLPLKYKLNFGQKENLKTKYILKKLFSNFFSEDLIKPKEGFSGFPNEIKKFQNISFLGKNLNNLIFPIKNKNVLRRDEEWKKINITLFNKLIR